MGRDWHCACGGIESGIKWGLGWYVGVPALALRAFWWNGVWGGNGLTGGDCGGMMVVGGRQVAVARYGIVV